MQSETTRKWLMRALVALPALVHLFLVLALGVDVPFWDDFTAVLQRVVKHENQGFRLEDALMPQNEHMYAVPGLVVLGSYELLGRCDLKFLMVFGWAVWSFASVALWWVGERWRMPPWAVFLAACHLHGMSQYEAIFWATPAVQYGLLVGPSVAALAGFAYARKPPALAIASTLAAVAAFSSSQGIVTTFIGAAVLAKRGWRKLGLAVFGAGASGLLLLFAYRQGGAMRTPDLCFDPVTVARFSARVLGSSFPTGGGLIAEALGYALVVALILTGWRLHQLRGASRDGHALFVAALIALALGWALLTAVGRGGLGLELALARRYAVVSQIAFVALTLQGALLWPASGRARSWRAASWSGVIATAMVSAILFSNAYAWEAVRETHRFRSLGYEWVSSARIRDHELSELVWDVPFGREMLAYACPKGWLRACSPSERREPP